MAGAAMAERLILRRVGLKSPLDDGGADRASEQPGFNRPVERSSLATMPPAARDTMPAPVPVPAAPPFYGTGRPLQTSIALDEDCALLLDQFARAAGVSLNALAVAVLHSGLPSGADEARLMICEERVERAGSRSRRLERNLRLPEGLRTRIDELMAVARPLTPRATRADLINAAFRRGLPPDGKRAAALVIEHAQRAERAAMS